MENIKLKGMMPSAKRNAAVLFSKFRETRGESDYHRYAEQNQILKNQSHSLCCNLSFSQGSTQSRRDVTVTVLDLKTKDMEFETLQKLHRYLSKKGILNLKCYVAPAKRLFQKRVDSGRHSLNQHMQASESARKKEVKPKHT